MADTVSFRPDAGLQAELEARQANGHWPGVTARRDMERYYEALRRELATVTLAEGETCVLVDALNGVLTEPHTVGLLWASIDDAIRSDGLDRKWGIDGPALVEKLRGLTYTQSLALADAVERWWNLPPESRNWPDGLRAVGLIC